MSKGLARASSVGGECAASTISTRSPRASGSYAAVQELSSPTTA